ILSVWFNSFIMERKLSLSDPTFHYGWTLFTYSFLHGSVWHLLANTLGLFYIGKFLLDHECSPKFFLALYLTGVAGGGILWLLLKGSKAGVLMGSSAGVMALLIYFCQTYPHRSLTLLLYFFIPISLQAKWLGYGLWFYEIFQCLSKEVHGVSSIASSAHLGGMLVGLGFAKARLWSENRPVKKPFRGHFIVHAVPSEEKLEEIRRKIQVHGFGSLSNEEREFLEQYSRTFR
ncbi:MAG: rhomboid family intramembrane serine protease, partial [Puniceicoccales bacterium]|nr:rhomboid family intramembrane serine protease [Puniceicoccales bacterium]